MTHHKYDHSAIIGIQGLVDASALVAFPSQIFLSIKPGVWNGVGMDLHTAQVQLTHSTASGTVE